jgi:hypothetical protein
VVRRMTEVQATASHPHPKPTPGHDLQHRRAHVAMTQLRVGRSTIALDTPLLRPGAESDVCQRGAGLHHPPTTRLPRLSGNPPDEVRPLPTTAASHPQPEAHFRTGHSAASSVMRRPRSGPICRRRAGSSRILPELAKDRQTKLQDDGWRTVLHIRRTLTPGRFTVRSK